MRKAESVRLIQWICPYCGHTNLSHLYDDDGEVDADGLWDEEHCFDCDNITKVYR